MEPGGRTPEELETLLEDALVVEDAEAIGGLFEPGAVLAHGEQSARGIRIAPLLCGLRRAGFIYVAAPQRVLQADDTALIVAGRSISVVHRDATARWRYAITAIDPKGTQP
jgi:hypothetical protein